MIGALEEEYFMFTTKSVLVHDIRMMDCNKKTTESIEREIEYISLQ